MENPRKDPIVTTVVGYGEHAIGMGPVKLGQTLDKCLSEINLLLSLPPDMPSRNVMEILKRNIQNMMGVAQVSIDD